MKKSLILFLIMFPIFVKADDDFTNMCGVYGYSRIWGDLTPNQYTCSAGNFLPANAIACVECPLGYTCSGGTYYFNETDAQGLIRINPNVHNFTNEQNTCAANIVSKNMYAIMQPISVNCANGQFLPADSTSCATCPNGYTCSGGTYYFNGTEAQGITQNNNEIYATVNANNTCSANLTYRTLNAVFTINSYNCIPGYYLPADTEGCVICPAGSYCVGGTYTFNETTAQGIETCPSETISYAGAPACFPHVLHIGNEMVYLSATKRTTPSLNVAYGNDVFYANMTTTRTVMTAGSSHYLKTIYNNAVYYMCDDSVPECRGE